MRCCFFGTYPRAYTVSRILRTVSVQAGFEVRECHVPVWEKHEVKEPRYFRLPSLVRHALDYLGAVPRLARAYQREAPETDVWLVGFQGQLDVLLLRLLRARPPVVFAPLVSLTETLVDDRQIVRPTTPAGRLLFWLDRKSLEAADLVLSDTVAHAEYLRQTFAPAHDGVRVFYLGPDWSTFCPAPLRNAALPVRVLFYGSFLPLHGVSTILGAADALRDNSMIRFTLCGDGWQYEACRQEAQRRNLANVTFLPWIPYAELPELIAAHDICLGVFGAGLKSRIVIPNKLYQCAAVGRPIISADTPAVREVFTHRETACLVPGANPERLAEAIAALAADAGLRSRLARQSCDLMREKFSPALQGQRFRDLILGCSRR